MKNLTKEQAKNIREMNISKRNKTIARKIVRWVNNQESFPYNVEITKRRICFTDCDINGFCVDIWLSGKDMYDDEKDFSEDELNRCFIECSSFEKLNFEKDLKFVGEIGKILFG